MNCTLCLAPMDENINGKYCPRGCDCIPQVIGSEDTFASDAITSATSFDRLCCVNPEIAPFELRGGVIGNHCWTCGKVGL